MSDLVNVLTSATKPTEVAGSSGESGRAASTSASAPAGVDMQQIKDTTHQLRAMIPGELAAQIQSLGLNRTERVIPGELAYDLELLKAKGISAVPERKVIPGELAFQLTTYQNQDFSQLAAMATKPIEQPEEKPAESFIGKTMRGLGYIPEAGAASVIGVLGTPTLLGGILENQITGKTDGRFYQASLGVLQLQEQLRSKMMADRDPEQSNLSKAVDPSIIIPGIVDFGVQIVGMGGMGAVVKKGASRIIANEFTKKALAVSAASLYGGTIEGTHTYYNAIDKGMSQSEALKAFAQHTAASTAFSAAQVAFTFGKLPGPLQQSMVKHILAGSVDAVTESMDEVAGSMALGDVKNFTEALNVFKGAIAEIGPAALIVGFGASKLSAPPTKDRLLRAPTASEVEAGLLGSIGTVDRTNGAFQRFAEDKIKHVLDVEADYFIANGKTYSTKTGRYRGAVVNNSEGAFWISGQNAEDGIYVPVDQIVEVGKYDENGLTVPILTSQTMQSVYAEAENIENTLWGEDLGFSLKSESTAAAYEQEVQRVARNAVRDKLRRRGRIQTAEFDREVEGVQQGKMQDLRRMKPRTGDEIAGLERAVKEGIDSGAESVPVDVPARPTETVLQNLIKKAEEKAKTPSSIPSVQKAQRQYTAGLDLGVAKGMKAVSANMGPSEAGSVNEVTEQGAAKLALGEEIMTMDDLMASEEVVRRMNDRLKAYDSTVVGKDGDRYTAHIPVAYPFAVGADEEASASSTRSLLGENLSDAQAAVARYAKDKEVFDNLLEGKLTPEDIMMKAFKEEGLLDFVPDTQTNSMHAVQVEGTTEQQYQGALSAYVTNVRRLKAMLYYVHEGAAVVKDTEENIKLSKIGTPTKKATGGSVLYSSKGATSAKLNQDHMQATASYMAAMRHTSMYHSLVRAGQTLGWMDPYASAEIGSEMVFAMAQAWSGQTKRPTAEFYDKYLGQLEAHATEMTKGKLEEHEATRGFGIPPEMLFSSIKDVRTGERRTAVEQEIYDIDQENRRLLTRVKLYQDLLDKESKKLASYHDRAIAGEKSSRPNEKLPGVFYERTQDAIYKLENKILRNQERKRQLVEANSTLGPNVSTYRSGYTEFTQSLTGYSVESLRQAFNLTTAEAKAMDFVIQGLKFNPALHLLVGVISNEVDIPNLLGLQQVAIAGVSGALQISKSKVSGTATAEITTALHEIAHAVRTQMLQRGKLSSAELKHAREWAKARGDADALFWGVSAEERFAEAFVQYAINDDATDPKMRAIFSKMRVWMIDSHTNRDLYKFPDDSYVPEAARTFNYLLNPKAKRNTEYGTVRLSSKKDRVFGTYDPYTHNIQFFLGSDLETVIHEFSHAFRHSLPAEAQRELEKWIYKGKKRPDKPGQWSVAADERFANAFVNWVHGKTEGLPAELQPVFSKAGAYLTQLYATGRALKPAQKVSEGLAGALEKLITKQLKESADPADRAEAAERERVRREFHRSKRPIVNLGDHMEATAEFLGIDKLSISRTPGLDAEVRSRLSKKGYEQELRDKLAASEGTGRYEIDIVDFVIVRNIALGVKSQFETEFREAYNKGPAAVQDMARRWQKRKAFQDIKNYLGVAGDAGRRLGLLTNKATLVDTAMVLDETQKRYGAKGFEILYQMISDPDNAHKIANEQAKEQAPGLMGLFSQFFYNNFMSGPKTLGVNFVFTGLWAAFQYGVHTPIKNTVHKGLVSAAALPKVGKLVDAFYFQGNTAARDAFVSRTLDAYAQLGHSVPQGLSYAANILKHPDTGLHAYDTLKGVDIVAKDINSWQRYLMPRNGSMAKSIMAALGKENGEYLIDKFERTIRTLGPAMSIFTNIMRASDMIFKTVAAEGELNRLVQEVSAKKFPNDRKAQRQHTYELTKEFSDKLYALPDSWKQQLAHAATYNTFMDLPGPVGRHLLAAREAAPLLKVIFPFFNTLINIGKRGLEMTPGIGLVAEYLQSLDKNQVTGQYGHTKADIIAKQIEGSMLAALMLLFLDDDRLTAEAPEDPKEKALFYASGKRPFHIRVGDKWVNYENLDPFSIPLKLIASLRKNVINNWNSFGDPSPEVQERVARDLMAAGWTFGSLASNSDFMRTFETYAEAKTLTARAKALGSTIEGTLVPYSGLIRWMQRKADMYQDESGQYVPRQQLTLADKALPLTHNIVNRMFGLPETTLPRLTVWGEPYSYSDNKWYETWWPAYYTEAEMGKVDLELERLQYAVGFPSRYYERLGRKYEYSPEVYQQLVLAYGQEGKQRLEKLISSSGYDGLPDHLKFSRIESTLEPIRSRQVNRARMEQRKLGEILVQERR